MLGWTRFYCINSYFSFVYEDEIGIAQNITDWEYEQDQERGNKDIVLMHFGGLGDTGNVWERSRFLTITVLITAIYFVLKLT